MILFISDIYTLQLLTYFGDIKTYGEDFGSRNEGRRYFVPEYQYIDDEDKKEYTR